MNRLLRPKVTIVLPMINHSSSLSYALESILWQSFDQFEVWIIGDIQDSEAEDAIDIIGDPRIFFHHHPFNGHNEAELLTEGIRRARGEYVAYLGPNDLWLPNHLSAMVNFLESRDLDIGFSILQSVYSDNSTRAEIPLLPTLESLPELTVVVHRKSIIEDFHEAVNPSISNWFDKPMFFAWAKSEGIGMDRLSVTTGLKFLANVDEEPGLQPIYIDRLRRDPDFMNKELSALLVRAEQALHGMPGKKVLSNIIKLPLTHFMNFKWYPRLFFWQRRLNYDGDRRREQISNHSLGDTEMKGVLQNAED